MNPEDIRVFVKRDWALIERFKEDQRAESYRTLVQDTLKPRPNSQA